MPAQGKDDTVQKAMACQRLDGSMTIAGPVLFSHSYRGRSWTLRNDNIPPVHIQKPVKCGTAQACWLFEECCGDSTPS